MPAPNERFGATAAVTPQKVTCEHERKQPAERAVEAATSQSRRHVVSNAAKASSERAASKREYNLTTYNAV